MTCSARRFLAANAPTLKVNNNERLSLFNVASPTRRRSATPGGTYNHDNKFKSFPINHDYNCEHILSDELVKSHTHTKHKHHYK